MSRKPLIDQSGSNEERIKKLEQIVKHLSRRSRKQTTAIITPFPISNAVFAESISGPVLRYVFPSDGTITKGVIDLGKKPREQVTVEVDLRNKNEGESRIYFLSMKTAIVNPMIEVLAGDKLTVSIFPNNESEDSVISEVWIGLLWVPDISETDIHKAMINDLLEE